MKSLQHIILSALLLGCLSCKKDGRIEYTDSNAPAPAQINNVQVTAVPGGAIVTYKLPTDQHLSYVKAVYETRPGNVRETKASYFTDTLHLTGFGDTALHKVQLFSVGRNEKASAPVEVSVKPLLAPVLTTFASLAMAATFGGVQISFRNDAKDNLAITVMLDSTGQNTWTTINTFYTAAPSGNFSVRGFDTTARRFAVFVRDRWNNKSDTMIKPLKPIYEVSIPKNTWNLLKLPTDTWQAYFNLTIDHLWDNKIDWYDNVFASTNASTIPQWFTIDIGQKVIISRIIEHQFRYDHLYAGGAVKRFELWGTNNPSPDGSWANWELLGTFNSFKPSGLPMGNNSAEDMNYAWFHGEDFTFDHLVPAVRYIRFKTLEAYDSPRAIVIAELDLWGQIVP